MEKILHGNTELESETMDVLQPLQKGNKAEVLASLVVGVVCVVVRVGRHFLLPSRTLSSALITSLCLMGCIPYSVSDFACLC